VTWDEDDGASGNRIATIMIGQRVKPGQDRQHMDHYVLLRIVEELHGLPLLKESVTARSVKLNWLK
jgi:hypothetical protein